METVDARGEFNSQALNQMKEKNPNLGEITIDNNVILYKEEKIYLNNFNLHDLLNDPEFQYYLEHFKPEDIIKIISFQINIINEIFTKSSLKSRDRYYDILEGKRNYNQSDIDKYRDIIKKLITIKDFLVNDTNYLINEYEFIMQTIEAQEASTGTQQREVNYYHEILGEKEAFNTSIYQSKTRVLSNGESILPEENERAGYINSILMGILSIISGVGLALYMYLK